MRRLVIQPAAQVMLSQRDLHYTLTKSTASKRGDAPGKSMPSGGGVSKLKVDNEQWSNEESTANNRNDGGPGAGRKNLATAV